jgi:hypothetical protein
MEEFRKEKKATAVEVFNLIMKLAKKDNVDLNFEKKDFKDKEKLIPLCNKMEKLGWINEEESDFL